jgi:lambda family phage holin
MKLMDNKPDFWLQVRYWLASIKAQGIGAFLSAIMSYLRGCYNGGKLRHTQNAPIGSQPKNRVAR